MGWFLVSVREDEDPIRVSNRFEKPQRARRPEWLPEVEPSAAV